MALSSISPIDGRYHNATVELNDYFSEKALIKYRLFVEIQYLLALKKIDDQAFLSLKILDEDKLVHILKSFSTDEAQKVKDIEKITNHDIKAVEYYLKDQLDALGYGQIKEFVHIGLTSQDINNTAFPLMINEALQYVILPYLEKLMSKLFNLSEAWIALPMLAYTHGQPATPTTLGKEFLVFYDRLKVQYAYINQLKLKGKFGGASGSFNAHVFAFPQVSWVSFADEFCAKLGLERSCITTQIDHYDNLADLCDCLKRINNILIDFSRDVWAYVSMNYFKLKIIKGEVGSSAMPHKVNPIDFENAEGNLGLANAIFEHLSAKLPVSRLQRDLSDSTVLRNIGVPFAHSLIAFKSILKGLDKLDVNTKLMLTDLDNNWAVISEAIQTLLRSIMYPEPYETLKALTRNGEKITKADFEIFIDTLDIKPALKDKLKNLTPDNYVGLAPYYIENYKK